MPESREKRRRGTEGHDYIFFLIFQLRPLKHMRRQQRPPKPTFLLFFVSEVLSKEGEGNYFYLRHLFYLKPLFKCWFDLLSVAGESTKLKKKMGMQY